MDKPITIIGHGLSGCVLALTLYRKNIPFQIFGTSLPGEASMASSGLIATVTGRRYVKAWNIESNIVSALDFYRWSEALLGQKYFHEVEIIRFLSNDEARLAWEKRAADPEYVHYISQKAYPFAEKLNRPYGILTGGYRLDTPGWMDSLHRFLWDKRFLTLGSQPFSLDQHQEGITILATGAVDPMLSHGIIPNKGEALIVRMPEWKIPIIMKDEVFIVPLEKDLYWIGSYYQPWPSDPYPSEEGRKQLLTAISKIYEGPIEIIRHFSGVRPTVDDRRPVIGAFPGKKDIYIFNGMGTKATSLAPYWAEQLLGYLTQGLSLPKEVSPDRF